MSQSLIIPENETKARNSSYFVAGQSGNPGGRPKGLAAMIREKTNNGKEIVDFFLAVLRNEVEDTKVADRREAGEWLADRAFGKSVELHLDLTPESEAKEASKALAREILLQALELKNPHVITSDTSSKSLILNPSASKND